MADADDSPGAAESVDPELLRAWLAARSVVRGLPPPVRDHGGLRVDTRSEAEVRRWVFARPCEGLVALGRTIQAPRHVLKLCGAPDDLRAALPAAWRLHPLSFFMTAGAVSPKGALADGYVIETTPAAGVAEVRVRVAASGDLAASGYAVETGEAFVYDRIGAAPEHRRRGLGRAVMAALAETKRCLGTPELLVATREGRALYASLGWRTLSPYATASILNA